MDLAKVEGESKDRLPRGKILVLTLIRNSRRSFLSLACLPIGQFPAMSPNSGRPGAKPRSRHPRSSIDTLTKGRPSFLTYHTNQCRYLRHLPLRNFVPFRHPPITNRIVQSPRVNHFTKPTFTQFACRTSSSSPFKRLCPYGVLLCGREDE